MRSPREIQREILERRRLELLEGTREPVFVQLVTDAEWQMIRRWMVEFVCVDREPEEITFIRWCGADIVNVGAPLDLKL